MTRSTLGTVISSALMFGACALGAPDDERAPKSVGRFGVASPAMAQPHATEPVSAGEAKRLGAAAGVISPRLADCNAHCAKQLGDMKRPMSEQQRAVYTQSCREACESQMAGFGGPPRQRARKAAADWQSLYLSTMLMEQSVFCIGKLGDQSAEARTLVKALQAAKQTPEALAADDLERRAAELNGELGRAEEGRRARAAHEELIRLNKSKGPRSPEANAAREAVSRARAVADATALGERVADAAARAQEARAKANETAAAAEAMRAYQAHNEAVRGRLSASPPAEQSRQQIALTDCFKAFGEERMRGTAKR